MARVRVSTTVDEALLRTVRELQPAVQDSALLDQALAALVALHRETRIDDSYRAYDLHPLDEPDEWGDLASFRAAVP